MERLYFPSFIKFACGKVPLTERGSELVSMTTTSVTCEIRLTFNICPAPEVILHLRPLLGVAVILALADREWKKTLCWQRKRRTWKPRECVLLFCLCVRVSLTFMDCACYVESVERCWLVTKRILFLPVCPARVVCSGAGRRVQRCTLETVKGRGSEMRRHSLRIMWWRVYSVSSCWIINSILLYVFLQFF